MYPRQMMPQPPQAMAGYAPRAPWARPQVYGQQPLGVIMHARQSRQFRSWPYQYQQVYYPSAYQYPVYYQQQYQQQQPAQCPAVAQMVTAQVPLDQLRSLAKGQAQRLVGIDELGRAVSVTVVPHGSALGAPEPHYQQQPQHYQQPQMGYAPQYEDPGMGYGPDQNGQYPYTEVE